jgi:lia operon protein LiaG
MSDRLKDFISGNRAQFDQFEPPDLWAGIHSGVKDPTSYLNLKKLKTMTKYGFGASAIVIASSVLLYNNTREISPVSSQTPGVAVTQPSINVADTPKVVHYDLVSPPPAPPAAPDPAPTPPEAVTFAEPASPAETPFSPPVPDVPPVPPVGPVFSIPTTDTVKHASGLNATDTIFKGVKRLKVDGKFCNISIKTHGANHVRLRGQISASGCSQTVMGTRRYKQTDYAIRFERDNDLLKVWIEDVELKEKVQIKEETNTPSFLNFEVPEDTEIDVDNNSGNIGLSGSRSKLIDLHTSFGNITANDITGNVKLKSSSGNINGAGITGDVNAHTSFGNQHFENLKGNVQLRSSSGDITLMKVTGNIDGVTSFGQQKYISVSGNITTSSSSGDVTIKNHSGNITVKSSFGTQTYDEVKGNIDATANSGDIKLNAVKGNLSLVTKFGSIRGKDVNLMGSSDFKASSGDIRLTFLNPMKDLQFDLVSGSGNISVDKEESKSRSDKKLQIGNGNIVVKGVTSFGDQSYK